MTEREEILEEQVKFSQMGQQVLNNEAYKQAIMARKAQIFDVFCNTKFEQSDVREEAWRTMQNIKALESFFEQALMSGISASFIQLVIS